MRRLFKKLEALFVAITFAEADDVKAAREVLKEKGLIREGLKLGEDRGKRVFTVHPVRS